MKKLVFKTVSIVLIPLFLVSNLTFAETYKPGNTATLARYSFIQCVTANDEAFDVLKTKLTQAWVRDIESKLRESRNGVTLEYAVIELIEQINKWTEGVDMPEGRKDALVDTVIVEAAKTSLPISPIEEEIHSKMREYIKANLQDLKETLPPHTNIDKALDFITIFRQDPSAEATVVRTNIALLRLGVPQKTIKDIFSTLTQGTIPAKMPAQDRLSEIITDSKMGRVTVDDIVRSVLRKYITGLEGKMGEAELGKVSEGDTRYIRVVAEKTDKSRNNPFVLYKSTIGSDKPTEDNVYSWFVNDFWQKTKDVVFNLQLNNKEQIERIVKYILNSINRESGAQKTIGLKEAVVHTIYVGNALNLLEPPMGILKDEATKMKLKQYIEANLQDSDLLFGPDVNIDKVLDTLTGLRTGVPVEDVKRDLKDLKLSPQVIDTILTAFQLGTIPAEGIIKRSDDQSDMRSIFTEIEQHLTSALQVEYTYKRYNRKTETGLIDICLARDILLHVEGMESTVFNETYEDIEVFFNPTTKELTVSSFRRTIDPKNGKMWHRCWRHLTFGPEKGNVVYRHGDEPEKSEECSGNPLKGIIKKWKGLIFVVTQEFLDKYVKIMPYGIKEGFGKDSQYIKFISEQEFNPSLSLEAVISKTEDLTKQITAHMELRPEGKIELSNFAVVMKKDLTDAFVGNEESALNQALKQRYQEMKQDLEKRLANKKGLIEVADTTDLVCTVDDLIKKGIKVVILDNGVMIDEDEPFKENITGEAGKNYCVVSANSAELDNTTMPFLNLNAMALMGVGVLENDEILFGEAYKLFTGKKAPSGIVKQLKQNAMWFIKVLPRIIKLSGAISDINKLRKLFDVAA